MWPVSFGAIEKPCCGGVTLIGTLAGRLTWAKYFHGILDRTVDPLAGSRCPAKSLPEIGVGNPFISGTRIDASSSPAEKLRLHGIRHRHQQNAHLFRLPPDLHRQPASLAVGEHVRRKALTLRRPQRNVAAENICQCA